jgi:hypothetical protein
MGFDPLDELIAELEQALPPKVSGHDLSAAGFAKLIALTDRAINGPLHIPPDDASPADTPDDPKATKKS